MVTPQDCETVDLIIGEEEKHLSELIYMANGLRGGAEPRESKMNT